MPALSPQLQTESSPDKLAQAFWNTVLMECPPSPSRFYSEKHVDTHHILGTAIDWTLTEFQGPFLYSPLRRDTPSRAEQLNTGREWSAFSTFVSTVHRTSKLHAVQGDTRIDWSSRTKWSNWIDSVRPNGQPSLGGSITMHIWKDRSGVTIDPSEWEPMSCTAATSTDPFSSSGVRLENR